MKTWYTRSVNPYKQWQPTNLMGSVTLIFSSPNIPYYEKPLYEGTHTNQAK